MSKSRSRRGSAVKDKWRNKTWYEVHAPSYFENVEIALSPAMDEKGILGRVFETTLYDITDDFTKSHITLKFQVNDVKGDKAYTILAACKGCGACASVCPEKAITMRNFTDEQLIAEAYAALEEMEVS